MEAFTNANVGKSFTGLCSTYNFIFVHFSSIKAEGFKTLNEGQAVTYNAEEGPKGLHAVEVEVTS